MGIHLLDLLPQMVQLPKPITIQVADGGTLQYRYQVPHCSWYCQGSTFVTDLKVLPLGCYDIVLGMDWLEAHSPMQVDWVSKKLSFQHQSRYITLQGVSTSTGSCRTLHPSQLMAMTRCQAIDHVLELRTCEVTEPDRT